MILLLFVPMNCFSQSKFNRIINLNWNANNILVSLTPNDSSYIIICGSNNYEMFGDRRCSLIAILDNNANCINKAFVGDSDVDTYDGRFNQRAILTNHASIKYVFSKEYKCIYICEFDNNLNIINSKYIYHSSDSSLLNNKVPGFNNIDDNIYIISNTKIDTLGITGFYHPILYKLDNDNNIIYKKYMYISNIKHQYANIIKAQDGNLIALGNMNSSHLWLISKIDTSGNMMWYRTYGRTDWLNSGFQFISPSPDNCYVMSGIYPVCYANRFEEETSDAACIRKIDDNGNLLWEKVIKNYNIYPGIAFYESAYDIYVDGEGFIYVVGMGSNCEGYAGILLKLTPNGEIVYRRNYSPTGSHDNWPAFLNSVKPTPDGGLIMGGYTYDDFYGADFDGYYQQPWLVKTDMEGLDGLCYTELPELDFDIFIPDTVCNLDTIDCVVNISGPSAPYTMEFSTGQVIDNIYYPDIFIPKEIGIDTEFTGERLYQYTETITEATLKDTAVENVIARHYNIRTPMQSGEQQLTITLTDFYGNTKTITKDLYVNHCNDLEVDENENIVLSVYPNPATECINIAGENIASIEICNLLGGVVYEKQNCSNNNVISTENMPAGSYFVRVKMVDGKVITKKVIIL